jgi:hypothetical protein
MIISSKKNYWRFLIKFHQRWIAIWSIQYNLFKRTGRNHYPVRLNSLSTVSNEEFFFQMWRKIKEKRGGNAVDENFDRKKYNDLIFLAKKLLYMYLLFIYFFLFIFKNFWGYYNSFLDTNCNRFFCIGKKAETNWCK